MRPEIYIVAAIVGWGVGSFFSKYSNDQMHPIMVSAISLAFYVILEPMLWVFVKFDKTITLMGVVYTLIASLFMCVGTLGFSYALRGGGAVGTTTVVTALYPALTVGLSVIFTGESMTIRKGIGIILALISVGLLAIK